MFLQCAHSLLKKKLEILYHLLSKGTPLLKNHLEFIKTVMAHRADFHPTPQLNLVQNMGNSGAFTLAQCLCGNNTIHKIEFHKVCKILNISHNTEIGAGGDLKTNKTLRSLYVDYTGLSVAKWEQCLIYNSSLVQFYTQSGNDTSFCADRVLATIPRINKALQDCLAKVQKQIWFGNYVLQSMCKDFPLFFY